MASGGATAAEEKSKEEPPSYDSLFPSEIDEICVTHGKELTMFCDSRDCKIAICQECLDESHTSHLIKGMDEEHGEPRYKPLLALWDKMSEKGNKFKNSVEEAEKKVSDGYANCLEVIQKESSNLGEEKCAGMLRELTRAKEEMMKKIAMDLALSSEFLQKIEEFRKVTNETTTHDQIKTWLEKLPETQPNIVTRSYFYYEFSAAEKALVKRVVLVHGDVVRVLEVATEEEKRAIQFSCEDESNERTEWKNIFHISTLGPRVVICALHEGKWILHLFDQELKCTPVRTTLRRRPSGMTEVHQDGKLCLAVAYSFGKKIEFYREKYLTSDSNAPRIRYTHRVKSIEDPRELCAASKSYILYVENHENPKELRLLKCRGSDPKFVKYIKTQQRVIREISCVEWKGKHLVVVCDGQGVYAYELRPEDENFGDGTPEWSIKGKLPGMLCDIRPYGLTIDQEGHIFVSDWYSMCINVFSMDGKYLGVLIKEGERGMGMPGCIRWLPDSSSLVVTHFRDNHWGLKRMKIVRLFAGPADNVQQN